MVVCLMITGKQPHLVMDKWPGKVQSEGDSRDPSKGSSATIVTSENTYDPIGTSHIQSMKIHVVLGFFFGELFLLLNNLAYSGKFSSKSDFGGGIYPFGNGFPALVSLSPEYIVRLHLLPYLSP